MEYKTELIDISKIKPSPVNRQHTDESVAELAESIKAEGLVHPIVLRKLKSGYEIVAGERRWLAYKLNGEKEIPAQVHTMSDAEAHSKTFIENIQRVPPTPFEEAAMIKQLREDGMDTRAIASKFGKTVAYVAKREKLSNLSPKWMKKISNPKERLSRVSPAHLELIARYDHEEQDSLLDEYEYIISDSSVSEFEKTLSERHMKLTAAPWNLDDESLAKICACSNCQKRSGCAPDLFGLTELTVKKSDSCLDRECWGKKLAAYHELKIKEVKDQHPGMIILNKARHSEGTIPTDNALIKNAQPAYKYSGVKKTDPKAIPAYIVDGPGAGRIEYVKKDSMYDNIPGKKPASEKTLKEKRDDLEKRRIVKFINLVMEIVSTGLEQDRAITSRIHADEAIRLACVFGAASMDWHMDYESWDYLGVFNSLTDSLHSKNELVSGICERITHVLRQELSSFTPSKKVAGMICELLHLDAGAAWERAVKEVPEPKAWAKLKDAEPEPAKVKRYIYKGEEIFVSAGLGGAQYGTFKKSKGGSGVQRIKSPNLPMVDSMEEAQENLDEFAQDRNLQESE